MSPRGTLPGLVPSGREGVWRLTRIWILGSHFHLLVLRPVFQQQGALFGEELLLWTAQLFHPPFPKLEQQRQALVPHLLPFSLCQFEQLCFCWRRQERAKLLRSPGGTLKLNSDAVAVVAQRHRVLCEPKRMMFDLCEVRIPSVPRALCMSLQNSFNPTSLIVKKPGLVPSEVTLVWLWLQASYPH